jgi:alpha-tubulin suppressor-like RCC1 family protein
VPGLENVTKVDVGDYGVCAILEGGKLKCWGRNDNGEVGDGTTDPHSTPTQVKGLTSGVRQVSVGTNHVCALLANGKAKCWGNNDFGEVGDRSHDEQHQPTLVQGVEDARSISAGYYFTCATVNSKAKCWGYNEYGEVGNGSDDSTKRPSLVVGLHDGVKKVVAGYYQACAILTGGQLKCWGLNGHGEVGTGSTGGEFHRPQDVVGLAKGVTDVDPDYEFTCAIHIGRAKCWGNNYYGQIGNDGNNDRDVATQVTGLTQNVVDVDTGWYHACALLNGGAEKCWGYNGYGQIGNDDLVHTAIRKPMRVLL